MPGFNLFTPAYLKGRLVASSGVTHGKLKLNDPRTKYALRVKGAKTDEVITRIKKQMGFLRSGKGENFIGDDKTKKGFLPKVNKKEADFSKKDVEILPRRTGNEMWKTPPDVMAPKRASVLHRELSKKEEKEAKVVGEEEAKQNNPDPFIHPHAKIAEQLEQKAKEGKANEPGGEKPPDADDAEDDEEEQEKRRKIFQEHMAKQDAKQAEERRLRKEAERKAKNEKHRLKGEGEPKEDANEMEGGEPEPENPPAEQPGDELAEEEQDDDEGKVLPDPEPVNKAREGQQEEPQGMDVEKKQENNQNKQLLKDPKMKGKAQREKEHKSRLEANRAFKGDVERGRMSWDRLAQYQKDGVPVNEINSVAAQKSQATWKETKRQNITNFKKLTQELKKVDIQLTTRAHVNRALGDSKTVNQLIMRGIKNNNSEDGKAARAKAKTMQSAQLQTLLNQIQVTNDKGKVLTATRWAQQLRSM